MKASGRIRRPALSIVVAGILFALPVLGLDCEMTCVRAAPASPAPHCPSHDGAGSGSHPSTPNDSDCCVHHEDSPALKVTVERLGSRSMAIGAAVWAPPASRFELGGALVDGRDACASRGSRSHSAPILRL